VFVSEKWEYQIDVYDPDCATERSFARDYKPRRRSRGEINVIEEPFRRGGGSEGARFDFSKIDRDIANFWVRDDGRVWVLTGRGRFDAPAFSLGVFDVFDATGKLIEQVDLRGEGDPMTDRYVFASDRLFVIRRVSAPIDGSEADPEPMEVVCYRVPSR
jgi:hypothetical protein